MTNHDEPPLGLEMKIGYAKDMQSAPVILWLNEIDEHDEAIVGKQAVKLAFLKRNRVPVAEMFVVTAAGWKKFLSDHNLEPRIEGMWLIGQHGNKEDGANFKEVKKLIQTSQLPRDLETEILKSYLKLGTGWRRSEVIVRIEMTGNGQGHINYQQTVTGETNLLVAIKHGWAEVLKLFIQSLPVNKLDFRVPALVTRIHKLGKEVNSIKIQAETAEVQKRVDGLLAAKKKIFWTEIDKKLMVVDMEPDEVHDTEESPVGISSGHPSQTLSPGGNGLELIGEGMAISPGIVSGPLRMVKVKKDLAKVKKGEILILPNSNRGWVELLSKAKAIISKSGRKTSTLGIESREMGVPMVVFEKWPSLIKEGAIVTVDGKHGKVFKGTRNVILTIIEGSPEISRPRAISDTKYNVDRDETNIGQHKTATALDVWAAWKGESKHENADGVWLSGELVIQATGKHPKAYKKGQDKQLTDAMVQWLLNRAENCYPRPIWFRLSSLDSAQYQELQGGKELEEFEKIPWLGRRGAHRFIIDNDLINWELAGLKILKQHYHLPGFGLVIPWIRRVEELQEIKRVLAGAGLVRGPRFKLWIEITTPLGLNSIEDFADLGIDGFCIEIDSLLKLWSGFDTFDNESKIDDEHLGKLAEQELRRSIQVAHKHKLKVAIYGRTISRKMDLAEILVNAGVDRLVVQQNEISFMRDAIRHAESRLVK